MKSKKHSEPFLQYARWLLAVYDLLPPEPKVSPEMLQWRVWFHQGKTPKQALKCLATLPRVYPDGGSLILQERDRQVKKEGWTAAHDDKHRRGEMALAAVWYAAYAKTQVTGIDSKRNPDYPHIWKVWPWETKWMKPSPNPIRNLEKAGALIAAEIDRLQRLARKKQTR